MANMFWSMLMVFWNFLKYPIYLILILLLLFILLCFIFIVIGFIKGKRFKKGSRRVVKKHGFFRRLLIDLPKQFVEDLFAKDPDFFRYQGLIIFEGRQGSGKTTSMVEQAIRIQKEYPV